MDKKDKKKLCAQCEGSIPYQLKHCPFCGFEQQERVMVSTLDEASEKNSGLSALYNPPYLSQSIGEARKEQTIQEKPQQQEISSDREAIQAVENQLAKKELIIILLLSIGGQFMMLGLMLLFFSVDGYVTLQWKSKYWYFYCVFSIPFILLGLKSLKRFGPSNS